MNVMKVAHQQAKLLRVERPNIAYRLAFRLALIEAHKVNKAMNAQAQAKQTAILHFEGIIAATLVHFEKLGVNDYYIAVCNNEALDDYTLLQHKDKDNKQSALGWANYASAIIASPAQADQYVKAYPGVCKLHAQTHLSKTLDHFRALLAQA